jgi:hypothetical protein
MAEGEAKGELRNSRKLLRRLLEKRFGPLPEATIRRIEDSQDLARLEASILQAADLKNLDELQL